MIHVLAQQLNGWLGAVHLGGGHVEVVHKDDALEADRGAVGALPPPVQLVVYDLLDLRGRCMCMLCSAQPCRHQASGKDTKPELP
jgi:hypothetical protein